MEINLYHACRLAFLAGNEGLPWQMVLHVLREATFPELATYTLTEEDYKTYPLLKELLAHLQQINKQGANGAEVQ